MHIKKQLSFTSLRKQLSERLFEMQDNRQEGKVQYPLHDCFMSGFAMMFFLTCLSRLVRPRYPTQSACGRNRAGRSEPCNRHASSKSHQPDRVPSLCRSHWHSYLPAKPPRSPRSSCADLDPRTEKRSCRPDRGRRGHNGHKECTDYDQ